LLDIFVFVCVDHRVGLRYIWVSLLCYTTVSQTQLVSYEWSLAIKTNKASLHMH